MREIKFRAWDKEDKRWIPILDSSIWVKDDRGFEYSATDFIIKDGIMDVTGKGKTTFLTLDGHLVDVYPFDGEEALKTCVRKLGSRFALMQYTGLKDKNGKEIYEGDIVKCWDWGVEPNDLLCISRVEWDEDEKGWGLNPDPTEGDRYDLFRNVEIIGNIYENPELLKEDVNG